MYAAVNLSAMMSEAILDLVDELIKEKPHLADPLRFYGKAVGFMDAAEELAVTPGPAQTAYPPDIVARIVDIFSRAIELPEGTLAPLKQALELGEIDFTRLPLREVPAFSLPYAEEDLAMILFLVSRPFFLALSKSCNLNGRLWEEGKCPVCNAQPSLSSLRRDGRKELYCSFCGTSGEVLRAQCPVCLNQDSAQLHIFTFTGEEGFSVQTCDACKSYVKNAEPELLSRFGLDLADLMSLPLDMVIQQKGYSRRSPNPLGMINMNVRG
jgi:FdhE protein